MRVLLTTNPGIGHLHPMVPIARALQQAGHEVAFAVAQSFCARVESLGFGCFPAGLDWLESEAEQAFPELEDVNWERDPAWFLKNVFSGIAAQRMVPDLLDVCRVWKPDLLVRNDCEFGATVAAEILGLRYATISMEMFLPARWWSSYIAKQLASLREWFGLSDSSEQDVFHRHLYFSFLPPSFQFPHYTLPPTVHSLRPVIFDNSGAHELPAWIERLPSRPTVYVTLGTVFNRRPDMFRAIVEGLGGEALNLIITVGSEGDPERFGPQPDNIYIERYIPQSLLLKHCDLAITHAGFGTTLAILNEGLPSLAVPVSGTDPYRASRLIATGAGLALKAPGCFYQDVLGFEELSADTVRNAARELLENPRYRRNAERLRDEAKSLPGPERAVELLVDLASVGDQKSVGSYQLAN